MKCTKSKVFAYAICLLLLMSFVYADDLCSDSDDGKDYAEQGHVKYGVIEYEDLCVLDPDADMRVEEGIYLKEYYCTDDDQRAHKIVDCTREGFEKCKSGKCYSSSPQAAQQAQTPVVTGPECGNKLIEIGEDCDPPTKICFVGSDIGLCSEFCKCEIKIDVDGSDESETKEETVEKTVNESKTAAPKPTPKVTEDSTEDKDGISTEKDRLALPKEPKRGFFSGIWHWFFGLFD